MRGIPLGSLFVLKMDCRSTMRAIPMSFMDMKIIGDLYKPQIALLPIGGHYTMGPEGAVYACKLIRPKYVIPMHFSTFPVLTGTPEAFQELMKEVPGTTVILLKPGESTL